MRLATTLLIGLVLVVGVAAWWLMSSQEAGEVSLPQAEDENQATVLPARQPTALSKLNDPATANPALVRLVDTESRDRFDSDIAYAIPTVAADDEQAAVVAVLLDHTDSDTARHQAAELLRRSDYAALPATLVTVLNNPAESERFRSWAVQHLYSIHAQTSTDSQTLISTTLHELLHDRHVAVRREALLSLSRLSDPTAVEHAAAWLGDEQVSAADLALLFCENDARQHINAVRNMAYADDQPTRIAALVTLSEWGDEDSRVAMQAAADLPDTNTNVRLRRCGSMALERLDRVLAANKTITTETPR
jgi:hypothetical protein